MLRDSVMCSLFVAGDHPGTILTEFGIIAGSVVANIAKPSASGSSRFAAVSMRDLQFTSRQPEDRAPTAILEAFGIRHAPPGECRSVNISRAQWTGAAVRIESV